ncbi:MAG: hypothetical protein JW867_05515 [Candidatus Omnitrophica bacterium]|nr:hypothetical protein [Candidatus Omnitrophota bacterium]
MRKTKAQTYMDYTLLILMISVALAAMASYMYQSIHARVHHLKRDLTDPVNGIR